MNAPETSKDDLITMLKQPVEQKKEPAVSSTQEKSEFDVFENKSEVKPNPDDFSLPPGDAEPPKKVTDQPNQQDPDAPRPSSKPRLTDKEYEQEAIMAVEFFDGLNQMVLPWAYQRTIFTQKERGMLKVIQEKYKKKETILEPDEQKLMEKYLEIKDAIKRIPLNDTEKDMILMPLTKVFKKYNIQLSCEFMLLTALSIIYGPRYMPMFNRLENI